MEITTQRVKDIAELAQLEVRPQDLEGLKASMARILALAEQMQAVDTTGVEPLAHPLEQGQKLRPDRADQDLWRERYQALAPAARDGLYLVPRVVE